MDLFKKISEILSLGSTVTIVIAKGKDENELTTSVMFRNNTVADAAKDIIAPFVVTGSPEELDAEFVSAISAPLEQSKGLQTSMKQFEESQKQAKAQSAASTATKKAVDDAARKNKEKVDKLLAAAKKAKDTKKWDEAIRNLQEALKLTTDPAAKEKIEKDIAACKEKNVPSIFSFDSVSDEQEETANDCDEGETDDGQSEDETPEEPIDLTLGDED